MGQPDNDRPRSRYYQFEVKETCPEGVAFVTDPLGTDSRLVYFDKETGKGDRFFMLIHPEKKPQPDGSTKLVNGAFPWWATMIDEYPIPSAPKPLPRAPGSAPGASRTETFAESAARKP